MTIVRFLAFGVAGFLSLEPLLTTAGEPAAAVPPDLKEAWATLGRPADADHQELAQATVAVVRAGDEDDLDRLVERLEHDDYLRKFAYPKRLTQRLESYPFSTLVRDVARCNNTFSEKLLIRLAQSETVSGKLQGGVLQKYKRSIAIVIAMGYLQPQTDETYEILTRGISRSLCMGNTIALASLVRIGDERAAKLIKLHAFETPKRHPADRIPHYLTELGRGRDRPAIFGLLLTLAEDAPSARLERHALEVLVLEKSVPGGPDDPWFVFPSYQAVSDSTRDKLRKLVKSVDTTKLSPESRKLIVRLREMVSRRQ